MNSRLAVRLICLLLFAVVAGFGVSSASSAVPKTVGQAPAESASVNRPGAGTYSAVMQLGGGLTFQALITMHADGTVTGLDVTDFGSLTLASEDGPHRNSVAVGSWKHTTGRSFVATSVFYRSAVGGTDEVDSVGRLSLTGTFDVGFDSGSLEVIVESFACVPESIGCPDPALLPAPMADPIGTFTFLRILPN